MKKKKGLTRVYKAARVRDWKSPQAGRMLSLLQQAIDEGRSFTLEIAPDSGMRIELGPKMPRLVHVRVRGKRMQRSKGGAS